METKANYVAVGAFVLACIIGFVVTVLWLAGEQYSQEYDTYQADFTGAVTGLSKGTSARYNGIEVGRVSDLEFDPQDPKKVIVTMHLQRHLNIRADSKASIESQGFAGAPFVEITGGSAGSPMLVAHEGQRYPVIGTKASTFAQLQESAPALLDKLNKAAESLNDLLSVGNRHAISHILNNLDETTQVIARRDADIDAIIGNANKSMANFNEASGRFDTTLDRVNLTVAKYGKMADDGDAFINGDGLAQLSDLIGEMRRLVANLTQASDQLNRAPTMLLFGDRRKGYEPKGAKQ
ncbi:MAG TPA: MlaD family protein [Rhizomicrobium sp.]|nr:MlaD family protein [Rhizomicrobium sp.]